MKLASDDFYIILDTINSSVYWKDLDGRYLGCNRYMLEMAGLSDRKEIIGKKDCELPWKNFAPDIEKIDQAVALLQYLSNCFH